MPGPVPDPAPDPAPDPLVEACPLFALTIRTSRLTLRLPREHELTALAQVAADGLHPPDQRPFLTPWTEVSDAERARAVVQGHWEALGTWRADDWSLGLAVFADDQPIGSVTLRARDFAVVREVRTSSWLGLPHQGRGLGTEARVGVLTLAFDHLDAVDALSEVFTDNHASQAVSRSLGYVRDGISRDARGQEALVSDRLRLTRDAWRAGGHHAAQVTGLDRARTWFGV